MTGADRSTHHTLARDGAVALELAACSDRGPVRQENQDAWAVRPMDANGAVVVLADGMGGHADGAMAAYLAVTATTSRLAACADPHGGLAAAVADANDAIAQRRAARGGPVSGTTLVAAVVHEGRASVVNVGDSRAYLVRAGVARQVSLDHSWVAEQVRSGALSPQAAATDQRRNVLTRALTGDPIEADGFSVDMESGDVLLLCSDGVWGVVDDAEIAAAAGGVGSLVAGLEALIDLALAAGSTDNVTAVACRRTV